MSSTIKTPGTVKMTVEEAFDEDTGTVRFEVVDDTLKVRATFNDGIVLTEVKLHSTLRLQLAALLQES